MLIVRHLGTPNSSFLLASLDVTVCVIQYYTDQWAEFEFFHQVKKRALEETFFIYVYIRTISTLKRGTLMGMWVGGGVNGLI